MQRRALIKLKNGKSAACGKGQSINQARERWQSHRRQQDEERGELGEGKGRGCKAITVTVAIAMAHFFWRGARALAANATINLFSLFFFAFFFGFCIIPQEA